MGKRERKYSIDFKGSSLSLFVDGINDANAKREKLDKLITEIIKDKKISSCKLMPFSIKVREFPKVGEWKAIATVKDELWRVIWQDSGGAVDGLRIRWCLNPHVKDIPEFAISNIEGVIAGEPFEIDSCAWFILKRDQKAYSFSDKSDLGHFSVPGTSVLTTGSAYYKLPNQKTHWLMDYRNLQEAHRFLLILKTGIWLIQQVKPDVAPETVLSPSKLLSPTTL